MNRVSLKLNPYQDFNTISLNEQSLSVYSELNNYMKEPFLKWADRFFDSVERELNDEFDLCVHSQNFEYLFLRALAKDFPDCVSLKREPFELDYSMEERLGFLRQLLTVFSIDLHRQPVTIFLEKGIFMNPGEGFQIVSDPQDAFLIITGNDASFQQYFQSPSMKIIVYISEEERLEKVYQSFLWKMTGEQVMEFLEAVKYRFYDIPYLIKASGLLRASVDVMSEEQKKYLELMTATDPYVSVCEIPDLEVGKMYRPVFEMIPASALLPRIRLRVINEAVIRMEDMMLCGEKQGTTVVEFYKNEELIPFDRQEVNVFQNHSIQRIDLKLYASVMGVNYTQTIGTEFYPPDADDIHSVTWSSSDPGVVSVDQNGKIISHSAGNAVITLSGRQAHSSVRIQVRPQLQSIELSLSEVACYVGEVIPLEVSIAPSDAYNRQVEWWTSDKMVAVVETTASGNFRIRAIGIGQCTLTCKAKEGNASASIEMFVDSTFHKRKKKRVGFFR